MMKKKSLKRAGVVAFVAALSLGAMSCGSTNLYSWYDYQEDYYKYVKNGDEDAVNNLIKQYDKIIAKPKAERGVVPPGIYADYGWLLIEAGKTEEGKAMLAKEIELYPESKVFVGSILKRLEK